jgi:hypothetical protein
MATVLVQQSRREQRLDELDRQILRAMYDNDPGKFFTLRANSLPQTVTFDLNDAEIKTRTIKTNKGDKILTRISVKIWNHDFQRKQRFELANKWLHMANRIMSEYKTDSLTIRRTGSGRKNTHYEFLPSWRERMRLIYK